MGDHGDSAPAGVVELREDVPLKAGAGGGAWCAGGPRLIALSFAVLSAAITLALLAQIYSGDYELVPHGVVSSSAAECSRAGTDALKAGGRALDAAAAAALCLAVVAPHRTSLDAGGSMLYWEYRKSRSQLPSLAEWGGAGGPGDGGGGRPPRLLVALAALHAQAGALPWRDVVKPALLLARKGFVVSAGLAAAERAAGVPSAAAGARYNAPALADYLQAIQNKTSKELSEEWRAWNGNISFVAGGARWSEAGGRRVWAGGARAALAVDAITAALQAADQDDAVHRAVDVLRSARPAAAGGAAGGAASGLAVVDSSDTYLALVTGTSVPFGSGPLVAGGWRQDQPARPLDLAPALIADARLCGTRYVVGAESSAALVQVAAALVAGGGGPRGVELSVERARLALAADGGVLPEPGAPPPAPPAAPLNATPPFAAVNVVQQRGDALLSWADSRGGGLASRF
ncbi:glutathione hydrolase 6 [Amyelois transitella]|uniref:glutathione hydrolase 6 n=1 Tax=Amyelois transitella TaxID=680683 RepID=UPI00298FFBD1|nr:glutathione hydrolase 6 [Amyelois transitella]